jgi:hypothetical protein
MDTSSRASERPKFTADRVPGSTCSSQKRELLSFGGGTVRIESSRLVEVGSCLIEIVFKMLSTAANDKGVGIAWIERDYLAEVSYGAVVIALIPIGDPTFPVREIGGHLLTSAIGTEQKLPVRAAAMPGIAGAPDMKF